MHDFTQKYTLPTMGIYVKIFFIKMVVFCCRYLGGAFRSRQIRIKDITKKAHVSVATVSRSLNDSDCVTDAMRQRVMDAVRELGYVPNSIAKSLKTNSTYTIGFLVPDISNHFVISIARIVEDIVGRQNYNLILCSTGNKAERELDYLKMLMSRSVDGLILNTTGHNDEFVLRMNRQVPIVLLNRQIQAEGFRGDLVDTNNYLGAYLLTKQLLALGHRKILVVRGPLHLSNSKERFQGFADAMAESGLTVNERYPYVYTGEFLMQSGIDAVDFFCDLDDRPTAILSLNNMLTVGILEQLHARNIRVPEHVSLVSYDAINNVDLMMIRPTSAIFDTTAIGKLLGRTILERIRNPESENRKFVFDPTIIQGNSLSVPRS